MASLLKKLVVTTSGPSAAREDYLKTIFHLAGEKGHMARTAGVAEHLGVSKPSVSAMLKRLAEEGLVDYSPRRGVRLTPTGREATLRVIRRHRLLETFMVQILGLDWSEVHEEAEVLEHHLSDLIVEAIDRALGHPTEDPHGHPIPSAKGDLRERELTPLGAVFEGKRGTVREVHTHEAERLQRWNELGLVPGADFVMRKRQEMEDVMHIDVGDRVVVTGSEGVEGILVECVES